MNLPMNKIIQNFWVGNFVSKFSAKKFITKIGW